MRGFHPASSVPRRRRFRRRRTENGRTIVAAVRTFHALRRTPSPPLTSPCGLSTSAHFQPTTNPAFSPHEAPGGLHISKDLRLQRPAYAVWEGRGSSRRWPPRWCLSLPSSGTRVSLTFRDDEKSPGTPGAAGGILAGEERPPPDRGSFDPEVMLWNGPFWRRKTALPGSG